MDGVLIFTDPERCHITCFTDPERCHITYFTDPERCHITCFTDPERCHITCFTDPERCHITCFTDPERCHITCFTLQEAAISVFSTIKKYLDDQIMRKLVLPKAKSIFTKSTNVRVSQSSHVLIVFPSDLCY